MKQLEMVCGNCRSPIGVTLETAETVITCPNCGTAITVHTFPQFFAPAAMNSAPLRITTGDESTCFHHPENQAAVPCDQCGRFLCALCDIQEGEAHFCPQCFSARRSPEASERPACVTRYDHVALSLAVLPLLFFPATLITAPAALYVAIRYRNRPMSILKPRRRSTLRIAILLALMQICGWVFVAGLILIAIVRGEY